MRILLDQGAPAPLRVHLVGHDVSTAFELGWGALQNGELLNRAEANGFQLLITTDQNLKYQQNLRDRAIAIMVLSTTSWPRIQLSVSKICAAADAIRPGDFVEIAI